MLFFAYNDILWYESFTSCLFKFPILILVELADDKSGNFLINFTGTTLDELAGNIIMCFRVYSRWAYQTKKKLFCSFVNLNISYQALKTTNHFQSLLIESPYILSKNSLFQMQFFLYNGLLISGMNLSHHAFVKFSFLAIDDFVGFHDLTDFILLHSLHSGGRQSIKISWCLYKTQYYILFVKLDIPF